MDARFWDLFWTTGMPEAWLMSRDGKVPGHGPFGVDPDNGPELFGPLAELRSNLPGEKPGGPRGLY